MIKILLVSIDLVNELLIVHLFIEVGLSLLDGVHPSEVIWAPHLVGVELIWASEFVSVFGRVNTGIKGVSSFEAEFFIPTVLGRVVVAQESKPGVFVKHRHF